MTGLRRCTLEERDDRSLAAGDLIDGLKAPMRSDLPGLLDSYGHVWHW